MEPTLSIQFGELQARVATFLGWGRGAAYGDTAWTSSQQFEIDGIVASGLRNFYYPIAMDGVEAGYQWSFLIPMATLSIAEDATTVALPDDYGSIQGRITVSSTQQIQWWQVSLVGIGDVYHRAAVEPTTTGRPRMACEEPLKGTGATQGQRHQLRFWPIADQDYTLQFQYNLNPDYLSGAFPFAYGGAQHAETLLESCLAVAEKRLDDMATVHALEFEKRLRASVMIDRRNKEQLLGYNGDRSDAIHQEPRWRRNQHGESVITVAGVYY